MYNLQSTFMIGEEIKIGDLPAQVTGIWFDGLSISPKYELTWFANGEIKTAWIREPALIAMRTP